MILFKKASDLRKRIENEKEKGGTIGFVPTMGALHDGHMSLIKASISQTGFSVCSIFVNPTQFNDPLDFQKYPVSLEKDLFLLEKAGASAVFIPSVAEIFPDGESGLEKYDLGKLEFILEGQYRPGHFQGVCQVMARLLGIVTPDDLFMGQKDFQQCLVVMRLIRILGIPVRFHNVPTEREADGLAQSSRNRRLTPEQRKDAVAISKALKDMCKHFSAGNLEPILEEAREKLKSAHFRTDYVAVASTRDLQIIENWNGVEKAVALIAAFQGDVRLIDNMLLN